MNLILEVLIMIILISFGFMFLGLVIPVGCTIGYFISEKIESFLCNL